MELDVLETIVSYNNCEITEENTALAHHGILGQIHGVRNGPPYPLDEGDHSKKQVAMAEATGTRVGKSSDTGGAENMSPLQKLKASRLQKERKKKNLENLNKAREAKKAKDAERKEQAAKKKKAIETGDARLIKESMASMTNQELQEAVNRMNLASQVNQKLPKEKTISDKIDSAMKKVDQARNWYETGKNAYNTFAKAYNSLNGDDDDLPVIGEKNSKRKTADQKKAQADFKKWVHNGDFDKIYDNASKYSTDELNAAVKRAKALNTLAARAGKKEKD